MKQFIFVPLLLILLVMVSGCTSSRMDIGNGGQSGDTERSMPLEPSVTAPEPNINFSGNLTSVFGDNGTDQLIGNLLITLVPLIILIPVLLMIVSGLRKAFRDEY